MAITVKYLEGLGIEKEIAENIFAERSREIAAEKEKREKLESEISDLNESLTTLNGEVDRLKSENADGSEWKSRFEALQAETESKIKQAEADRILKEKDARNRELFENALNACGKTHDDWNGKFTENGYYNEFVKAIELDENAGRSHKDILHELVKDDQNAFKGVTAVKLAGGTPGVGSKYSSRDEIMSIADKDTRMNEMMNNPQYFPEIKI